MVDAIHSYGAVFMLLPPVYPDIIYPHILVYRQSVPDAVIIFQANDIATTQPTVEVEESA